MYTVTLPNGRTYTFGPRKRSAAIALAERTGGTITVTDGQRRTYGCECRRPTCGGCDDAADAARDARLTGDRPGGRYGRYSS